MAGFIANYSNTSPSISDQWKAHLQQQEYVGDVTQAINGVVEAYNERAASMEAAIHGVGDVIADAAIAQAKAAQQNTASIVGAIDQGSANIVNELQRIGSHLNDSLETLIHQQRVGNLLAQNIAELMRIPDFQKERLYYMDQGFKHFKNAAIDPSMMNDALENLLEAEKRDKSDYTVLQCIGMIYIHSEPHFDAAKAEEYFFAGRPLCSC